MEQTKKIPLAPYPKSLEITDGEIKIAAGGSMLIDDRALYKTVKAAFKGCPALDALKVVMREEATSPILAVKCDASLAKEAYTLSVTTDQIKINYGTANGAFLALCTLRQLVNIYGTRIPAMKIEDAPDFPTRGYMLDIGRNKVPKLAQLCSLVDKLALLKINHLELYMEGVPFEYASYPQLTEGKDLLTGEDILALDEYCRDRFIELVPNQNNFGHMAYWIKNGFEHLAEAPDGFMWSGTKLDSMTLDPQNAGSEELVRNLADDLLPYFSCNKYNICCDETLELGYGKSKELCEKFGTGRVYFEFLKKVISIANEHGKRALFWGDIIKEYPELLLELPKDVIALEWGYYSDQPYADHCKKLQDAGVHYYICPGTGVWNTVLGCTDQMIANIRNAAERGYDNGACGFLLTDWGDTGHLQSIATAYPGIAFGASMSWGRKENYDLDIAEALDTHIYFDKTRKMGKLALDAGNYKALEMCQPVNSSHSFYELIGGLDALHLAENIDEQNFRDIYAYLDAFIPVLDEARPEYEDAELVKDEYRNSIKLVMLGQIVGLYQKAAKVKDTLSMRAHLERIARDLPDIISEIRRTWLIRNRYSYLDESLVPLEKLLLEAKEKLKNI